MAPSMLCHRHAIPCIWSYSARPAFQIASNTPAFSHSRNRLWIALALPKRSLGRAFHWQPVRSTKMMASNTCRAGLAGRPAPGLRTNALSGARTRGGINGSAPCQKSSVTTQESTRFLVATALPCAAQSAAQDASILFTDKFLIANCTRSERVGGRSGLEPSGDWISIADYLLQTFALFGGCELISIEPTLVQCLVIS